MKLRLLILRIAFVFFSSFAFATSDCESKLTFQQGIVQAIRGASGAEIYTYSFVNPNSDQAIVIAPGLGDASELLEENIRDLYGAGYSIFVIDHRGQGRSLLSAKQTNSHVEDYRYYISDFAKFVEGVVHPEQFRNTYLLGNSMGGAIGLLYMKYYPDVISKAVFLSPMYGLPKGPASIMHFLAQMLAPFGNEKALMKSYHPPFKKNFLTTDETRFNRYENFFREHPEVPSPVPSYGWTLEAHKMMASVQEITPAQVTTPILVVSAAQDKLVDNKAHKMMAEKFPNISLMEIPAAKHGPHFEQDSIREPLLRRITEFFEAN